MKTKIIWANFSVKDAKRTDAFYRQLSFATYRPGNDPRLASFAFGDDHFVIHFFEKGSRIDEYLPLGTETASEVIFTLSATTAPEADEWAQQVKNAGGTIFREPGRDDHGYYGFSFADPDGHKFNVLLMEKGM